MELRGAQRQVACGRAKDSCQSPWREGARKRSTEERTEIEERRVDEEERERAGKREKL